MTELVFNDSFLSHFLVSRIKTQEATIGLKTNWPSVVLNFSPHNDSLNNLIGRVTGHPVYFNMTTHLDFLMFCFNKSIIQIKKKFINSKHISKFQLISLTKQNNSNFFFKFETAPPPTPPKRDPCYPSPCGSNARCRVENDYAVCECLPEYHGNPYESCRPECLSNPDCPSNTACIRNKCQDPCPGTCGVNAICTVTNHVPVCTCQVGYTGDAFRYCSVVVEGIYQFFSNEILVSN